MKMTIGSSKENPTNSSNYYIETSIPIKLFFGHSKVKSKLREILAGSQISTSLYVRMEYKRAVVKTLIEFYWVAKEQDTPRDALSYYSEGYSNRIPKILLAALGEMLAESDIAHSKEKFLIKLETMIESTVRHLDNIVSRYVQDRTACPLAGASIAQGFEAFQGQIKCRTDCTVEELWKQNQSRLEHLVTNADCKSHRSNKGFQKPIKIISSAIKDPCIPKTEISCMRAGDFIIALEMPENMILLTFDKAFESICPLLQRRFELLPSPMSIQSS